MPQETDPPPSLLPTWVDMSRGDEVEAREHHRRRIMPGQGRVDPVRMEDEADDVVTALERDLPVLSRTPTTLLTGRRLVLFPRPQEERHVLFKMVPWGQATQVTCRWVWQRQSRPSHEAFIMAGSQCWQKTQTL